MHAAAIIPVRMGSTRLPGKALLDRTGEALVVHVARNARRARRIERLVVACDDQRIVDVVEAAGFEAVMTRCDHLNGTTRIAEATESLRGDIDLIVNVQGDEPEIDAAVIDRLVERMEADDAPAMATAMAPLPVGADPSEPSIVKCVTDRRGLALYFSRSPIPHVRDADASGHFFQHLGLYAYRRAFLGTYVELPPTPCEQAEKLEQLRALEHGYRIACITTDRAYPGIDTPADYEAFVKRRRAGHGTDADGAAH